MIAALFVQKGGVYYGLPDVDPWDEERDARLYAGPYPVVAHPPCSRWCQLASVNQARWGFRIGADDGCFAAALAAVRQWGGVLEHPAESIAWQEFNLPRPQGGGWVREMFGPGVVTEVEQGLYGHPARKRTWLYAVTSCPPAMRWGKATATAYVGHNKRTPNIPHLSSKAASATPTEFRDVLLDIARSVEVPA